MCRLAAQGFGCMSLSGGMYTAMEEASSETFEQEMVALLEEALQLGNDQLFLDTASFYGMGHNEGLVGKFLNAAPGRRQKVFVGTKLGVDFVDGNLKIDGTPENLRACVKRSLERLGTDYIDLVYLNRKDQSVSIEESWSALKEFVDAGAIRYLGVCEIGPEDIRKCHAIHPVSAIQAEWSLFSRDIETDLLPVCAELNIGIVAYSPLGRGLLTGTIAKASDLDPNDYRVKGQPRFSDDNLAKNVQLVEKVKVMATAKGCTAGQLACAWVMAKGAVPIPGTKRSKYLKENLAAASVVLSKEECEALESVVPLGAVAGDRYPAAAMKHITYHYAK